MQTVSAAEIEVPHPAHHVFPHRARLIAEAHSDVAHFRLALVIGAVVVPVAYFFWGGWFYVVLVVTSLPSLMLSEPARHGRRYLTSAAAGPFVADDTRIWREEQHGAGVDWANVAGVRDTAFTTLLLDARGETLMEVPRLEGDDLLRERFDRLPRMAAIERPTDRRHVAAIVVAVVAAMFLASYIWRGAEGLLSTTKFLGSITIFVLWIWLVAHVASKLFGSWSRTTDGIVLLALLAAVAVMLYFPGRDHAERKARVQAAEEAAKALPRAR